jgi:hypothetical protein
LSDTDLPIRDLPVSLLNLSLSLSDCLRAGFFVSHFN